VYSVPVPTASIELDIIELGQFKKSALPESAKTLSQLIGDSGIEEVTEHIE
jgi:hypothetical protein